MAFDVDVKEASRLFQEFTFVERLTLSAHKAAFYVKDEAGRDLCLKIISPDMNIERLSREVQALFKISHPNVVNIVKYNYLITRAENKHYIVEDFIEGYDLDGYLSRQNDTSNILTCFSKICGGLQAVHGQKIVHRDLKPQNIRVRPDGTPVIIDFGISRHLDEPDLTRTTDGAKIGTPKYFSPEQILGNKRDIEYRTDFFAIGVMMYEFIVGRHPFYNPGMAFSDFYNAVCQSESCLKDPDFLKLDNKIQFIISRFLKKSIIERPFDADKAVKLIGSAL
jgi:eukaryotic-like serine/threonine-protein kinase